LGETDRLPVMTQPVVRHTSSENTVASYFSDSGGITRVYN